MSVSADLVARLRCPASGSALRTEPQPNDQLVLVGGSVPYPVLLGIPRLIDDPLRQLLVSMLRAAKHEAAERLVLRWPTLAIAPRIRHRAARWMTRLAPGSATLGSLLAHLSDGAILGAPSFVELVRRYSTGFYVDWFMYRFNFQTFAPLLALSYLLERGDTVLEIGAGCGHSAFVIGRRIGSTNVVAVDHEFAQLAAAKRYNAPGAHYVCADVERGLPFASKTFSAVVMSDTFQFVHAKKRLVEETGRVVGESGLVMLSHIHNGLLPEKYSGEPLSPTEYVELFKEWDPHLVRNDLLIERLFQSGTVDLTNEDLRADLDSVWSLSLVGHRTRPAKLRGDGIWQEVLRNKTRLMLNPLLTVDRGRYVIREDIDPIVASGLMLPQLEGVGSVGNGTFGGLDAGRTEELLRRRIVLDVPEHFA